MKKKQMKVMEGSRQFLDLISKENMERAEPQSYQATATKSKLFRKNLYTRVE